jgi:probable phosphoglycerate mutase
LAQAAGLVPLFVASHQAQPFSALYATPLLRSQQTATPLATALALPVGIIADLQERAFGIIEGEPYATVRDGVGRTPELSAVAQALFNRDPNFLPPPGDSGDAETLQAFYDRVVRGSLYLAQRHAGEKIAVVVHGGVLDCLWRWAHKIDLKPQRTWSTVNASINVLRVNGAAASVLQWGLQAGDSQAGARLDIAI